MLEPQDESPVLDALERFADFVDEVRNQPKRRFHQWEGNVDQLAIRSIGHVLCKWRHASRPDRPPHALIVRLAKDLPDLLNAVCRKPKHLLSRQRSVQPLRRLRELDSTCVRWITRQPGVSLVEKAGHRQAVLAVERFESLNTLENRVVVTLLRLCRSLARDYLRQHQTNFPIHERVLSTAAFLKLCSRLLSDSTLMDVSPLVGVPKPNYVLLHDDRYHTIWRAYLEVARQQRRRQLLWSNRQQVFTDMAAIGFLHAVSRRCSSRQFRKAAHRHEVGLRQRSNDGHLIDWKLAPPVWQIDSHGTVFVGPGSFTHSREVGVDVDEGDSLLFEYRRGGIRHVKLLKFVVDAVDLDAETNVGRGTIEMQWRSCTDQERNRANVFKCPIAVLDRPNAFDSLVAAWCPE